MSVNVFKCLKHLETNRLLEVIQHLETSTPIWIHHLNMQGCKDWPSRAFVCNWLSPFPPSANIGNAWHQLAFILLLSFVIVSVFKMVKYLKIISTMSLGTFLTAVDALICILDSYGCNCQW